jgi:hypothetical protein
LGGISWNDHFIRGWPVRSVQSKFGFALVRVRAVAGKTVFRKERANVAIEPRVARFNFGPGQPRQNQETNSK